jgi:dihydropteroate synthase
MSDHLPGPPAGARLYLRPIWFVDTPVGVEDDQFRRLAGGLIWFQAVEARWITADGEAGKAQVPLGAFDRWQARLPDALAERAASLMAALVAQRPPFTLGERVLRFDTPQVMGILNMTPDSFSDGGKLIGDPEKAADSGFAMQLAGAAIIDVGGESTRPGAEAVWEGDEIARTVPVIERLARSGIIVSIDTRKAAVMEAALAAGARLVNDVSALTFDPHSAGVVAASGAPVVLMHHQGSPESMQDDPRYGDVLVEVYEWLEDRIAAAEAAGIARDRILVDPGFGFGKSVAHNLELMNGLALLHGLGCPIMLGASRKRTIGALSNEAPADQRLAGSIALALKAVEQGAQLLRVHDVAETVQAIRVWRGLRDQALTPRA